MAYEKVVSGKLFSGSANESLFISHPGYAVHGVTGVITGSSASPLAGHQIWDSAVYTLGYTAAGAGNYTFVLTGTVAGFTGLPIATVTGNSGVNTTAIQFTNYFGSASIVPTGLSIVQGTTGLMSYDIYVDAKAQRGSLRTGGRNAGRTMEGVMYTFDNLAEDHTETLDVTGATSSSMGLKGFRVVDHAMYWAVLGGTLSGTWDVDIVGDLGAAGLTVTTARTGTGGSIAATEDWCNIPIQPISTGPSIRPTQIIVTEVGAGAAYGKIVVAAKTGRGVQGRK